MQGVLSEVILTKGSHAMIQSRVVTEIDPEGLVSIRINHYTSVPCNLKKGMEPAWVEVCTSVTDIPAHTLCVIYDVTSQFAEAEFRQLIQ